MLKIIKKNKLLKDTASVLLLRVLGAALSFIYVAAIARSLEVSEAGSYFLAFSASMFLSTIARLGIDNAIVRFGAIAFDQCNWMGLNNLFLQVMVAVTILSLAFAIPVYFLALRIAVSIGWGSDFALVLQLTAIAIVPFCLMTIVSEFLRAIGDLMASVAVSSIIHITISLLILSPLVSNYGAEGAALAFLIGTMFSAFLGGLWWYKRLTSRPKTGRIIPLAPMITSLKHLFLVCLAGQAVMPYAPTIILGLFGSAEEVANFSVAARVCMIFGLLLAATNIVTAPIFAKFYAEKNLGDLERAAISASRNLTFVAIPLVLAGISCSTMLMSIFGAEYGMGAEVLILLLVGQLINAVTGSVGMLMMMTGYERELGLITLVSAIVMVSLCTLLIPSLGAIGAAAAASIAAAILNLSALHIAQRKIGIQLTIIPKFNFIRN